MTLKDIFDQLTYGELSQISIGGSEVGEINESNYPRIVSHIKLGLNAIYKRFLIKESDLIIQPVLNQTVYSLNKKFAVNNTDSTEPVKHIIDTVGNPYTGDLVKVEAAYTDLDFPIPLNNSADMYSMYTPTMDSIRIPLAVVNQKADLPDVYKGNTIKLVYRATHAPITADLEFTDISTIELELPDSYLELLLLYVAARVHTPIGAGQAEGLAANMYMAKYEMVAQQLENAGIQIDQSAQHTRLKSKGWA